MSSVTLAGVSKSYPGRPLALAPTDLHLDAGDRVALLGPTGSGKTTLLRLVAGLETPDAGHILLDNRPADHLPPHRRGVGLLAQRAALYPHQTVAGNLRFAANGADPPADVLDVLRLGPLLDRYPHQLSGGERQRAALGKLLAQNRPVWLLDEPFAGLDPVFRDDFRADLHLLAERAGVTMLIVTHDPADAVALGRRVGVLVGGLLQQVGTPNELRNHPGTRFVAAALAGAAVIDGRAGGGDHPGATFVSGCGSVAVPLPPGLVRRPDLDRVHNLTLGIRPEDLSVRPPGEAGPTPDGVALLPGWRTVSAEPVGSGWRLTLARGTTRVRAWAAPGSPPPVGAATDLLLPADRCLWFAADGRRMDVR